MLSESFPAVPGRCTRTLSSNSAPAEVCNILGKARLSRPLPTFKSEIIISTFVCLALSPNCVVCCRGIPWRAKQSEWTVHFKSESKLKMLLYSNTMFSFKRNAQNVFQSGYSISSSAGDSDLVLPWANSFDTLSCQCFLFAYF